MCFNDDLFYVEFHDQETKSNPKSKNFFQWIGVMEVKLLPLSIKSLLLLCILLWINATNFIHVEAFMLDDASFKPSHEPPIHGKASFEQ